MTLTAARLSAALRLGDTAEETAEAARLLDYASAAVTKHAPDAPGVIQNEAAIRLAGYLFDMPLASRSAGYADALRNSGAAAILLPHRAHRAGTTGEPAAETATAQAPAGLTQTGVEAVTVAAVDQWVSTGLPYPATAVFGVKVNEAPIELGRTADLPTIGVAAGRGASGAIGSRLYALGAARSGGVLFFASSTVGTFTVRLFDHA